MGGKRNRGNTSTSALTNERRLRRKIAWRLGWVGVLRVLYPYTKATPPIMGVPKYHKPKMRIKRVPRWGIIAFNAITSVRKTDGKLKNKRKG